MMDRIKERVAQWIAWHLPKRVAYWSYIYAGTGAMYPHEVVPEVRYMDLLERLERES